MATTGVTSGLNFAWLRRVPLVLQTEKAECGLACIAMLTGYYGYQVNLPTLRQRHPVGLKGVDLGRLLDLADSCNLSGRPLQADLDELKQLKLPAILHWDMNHFVVLVRLSGGRIVVHDPATGRRTMSRAQLADHYTGVAIELTPTSKFTTGDDRQRLALRQLWTRLTHYRRTIAMMLALSILLQGFTLLSPYYMQWVVDEVLMSHDAALLLVLALGFGLMVCLNTLISTLRSWVVLRASSALNLQMGLNLFRHLVHLPLDYFERRHQGDVLSRFGSLGQVRERITTGLVETLVDGVMSLTVLFVMLAYSVALTLVVLGVTILYCLIRLALYQWVYRASEEAVRTGALEQSNFLESLRGVQAIKLAGFESGRIAAWQDRFTDRLNAEIRLGSLNLGIRSINALLFGFENVVIVYLAAGLVMQGGFSIGMMLAFLAYKGQLTGRLASLVEQFMLFRLLRLHLDRIADIALAEPEESCAAAPPGLQPTGALSLKGVTFDYEGRDGGLLQGVNLEVEPGDVLIVTGPSGCGKTTLLKVMLGLHAPETGTVCLDGCNIHQLGLVQYRQSVAAVMQNDSLFDGTLLDNLSFFDPAPDLARVRRSAEAAAIHDDIMMMPMNYYSLVGDMGNQLSGGQVQRLLIARALYRQPVILFLDEALNQLDEENAMAVWSHLVDLGLTLVVISHNIRLPGIDRVIRLDARQPGITQLVPE